MSPSSKTITFKDLQKHRTEKDCWIAVHSSIYDVSDYIDSHPGGAAIILENAGKDATAVYDEVHPPELIAETLGPQKQMGLLDQSEVINLPEDQKQDINAIATDTEGTMQAEEPYSKPDLLKIISAHDFEKVAEKTLTPKAWAFYSSAASDLISHHQNHDIFRRIFFRPRILKRVGHVNMQTSIMGCSSAAPFFVSPAAMARLAHKDGEKAISRGCGSEGIVQCISSNASFPLQSIVGAGKKEQNFFFQLYVNAEREKTEQLLHKVRELGVKAIFVTVDAPIAGKREADERLAADRAISSGISGAQASNDQKGGGMGRLMGQYIDKNLNWDDLAWIKQISGLPVIVKGIMCAEDAKLAMDHDCEGVMLSNHGGRNLDSSPPAILTLLEIHAKYPQVFDKLEVYIDGGISRGGDILKALALGARAVGIGRPFLYSVNYGQEGVEHLCQILKDELATSMMLCGITDVRDAAPSLVNTGAIDHLVARTKSHPWISWLPKARL